MKDRNELYLCVLRTKDKATYVITKRGGKVLVQGRWSGVGAGKMVEE